MPEFRFPAAFARLGQHIPSKVATVPLLLILDLARRANCLCAPETLNGKRFGIRLIDLGLNLVLACDQGKFRHHGADSNKHVDVILSATVADFFKLASGVEDADTLFFRRRLRIEGDVELGIAVKYWIDASERPAWLRRLGEKLAASAT